MELNKICSLILFGLIFTSCSKTEISDAYGQFEVDEITISAETSGTLLQFDVEEGMKLESGMQVGLIDTTQLHLKKRELQASMQSVHTNIDKLNAQAEIYEEQLQTAQKELNRFLNLKETNAATQQQIDQADGQVRVLKKQIASVEVQKQSVMAELQTLETRIAQVEDQLKRAFINNPVSGTVLATFAELHELASPGKPLYQIADLEELVLRVYVAGAQLPQVKLGNQVDVLIDKDQDTNEKLSGEISWIASEAEFTPRMIQTKEERVNQVYAVKIRVQNPDGKLKIGMPGEVNF